MTLPESLDSLGSRAFFNDAGLKEVSIPAGLKHIGDEPFLYSGLERVTLPDNMVEMPAYMFYCCTKLTSISLPAGLKRIGEAALAYTSINTIDLPEGLEELGLWAFTGADFTEVRVPSSLKIMGDAVFDYCDKLEKVEIAEGVQELTKWCFRHCE